MTEQTLHEVDVALVHLRQMLSADGYELHVDGAAGGTVRLRVAAGGEACEECLVPSSVLEAIAMDAVGDIAGIDHVAVAMPGDRAD